MFWWQTLSPVVHLGGYALLAIFIVVLLSAMVLGIYQTTPENMIKQKIYPSQGLEFTTDMPFGGEYGNMHCIVPADKPEYFLVYRAAITKYIQLVELYVHESNCTLFKPPGTHYASGLVFHIDTNPIAFGKYRYL